MAPLRPRILVVEDTLSLLDLFRDVLGRAGFEIDTAATATEALDRLATRSRRRRAPQGRQPVEDRQVGQDAVGDDPRVVPLVLCSGMIVGDELRRQAADFGAAAVLEKPFSLVQLVDRTRLIGIDTPEARARSSSATCSDQGTTGR